MSNGGFDKAAYMREWRKANADKVRAYKRAEWERVKSDPKRKAALRKRANDCQKRYRDTGAAYAWRVKARLQVLSAYGGACECCGEKTHEFLAIDHVGGRKEHPNPSPYRGGHQLHLWLRANGFPSGYRVLCHNCNSAHGFYGYCPHNGRPEPQMRWRSDALTRRQRGDQAPARRSPNPEV